MTHTFIGDLGHICVIIAFIASLIAALSYWRATGTDKAGEAELSWKKFARGAFFIHAIAVAGVIFSLFFIIYNHYFEYHYAWSHSSRNLPTHYMISCFWEGQEGSFLLWIFWHVALGLILIKVNKAWEAPMMTIFCLVQVFLASMILGVYVPFADLKIGSSPFILLKDYMGDIPVYKMNPDFVPEDGTGLNPLLQNYWMVIHPPTLFLGFAACLVPFAYCIAGLWKNKFKEWIRPALPWTLFAALTLGTGILMGGYWAYETLNFGGYWNWDPVENAVYVPWLVLIGGLHTMISFKNSSKALKPAIILVISTFILILYSTFLTRSGILGDSSAHSFTDLGLSGQLLIYLLAFLLLSIFLLVFRWKKIPSNKEEVSVWSREFWIFIGATVLCLAAFQVLYVTSIPVYNAILNSFGSDSRVAPPAEPEIFYSRFQIWAGIFIAILSGVGQFFWWQKIDRKKIKDALSIPFVVSLLISSVIIFLTDLNKPAYILLLAACVFSLTANLTILFQVVKNNYKLSGGAMAHIGIALMLIGILYSSGYSKVVSLNTSGLLLSKEAGVDFNRDNILLWRNDPKEMKDFILTYKGPAMEVKGFPGYVKQEHVLKLQDERKAIARKDILYKDNIYYKKGDTLNIIPENTYFEVEFAREADTFILYPRAQVNPQMGLLASPDIKRFLNKDLYTHVSSIPAPDEEREWSETEEHSIKTGDTIIVNDFFAILTELERIKDIPGVKMSPEDIAVRAHFRVLGKDRDHFIHPVYLILLKEEIAGQIPDTDEDLGIKITFLHIDPHKDEFTFGVNTTQKDYIILKALEKPLINVLWIGTILLIAGLGLAIARRYSEFSKMREKGME